MTQEEFSCLYNIMIMENETKGEKLLLLKRICNQFEKEDIVTSQIGLYELIMTGIANRLGTLGEYDESDLLATMVLKHCLQCRRMGALSTNVYNNVWNYHQRKENNLSVRYVYNEKTELRRCEMLANIAGLKNREVFYQKMLIEWNGENGY